MAPQAGRKGGGGRRSEGGMEEGLRQRLSTVLLPNFWSRPPLAVVRRPLILDQAAK